MEKATYFGACGTFINNNTRIMAQYKVIENGRCIYTSDDEIMADAFAEVTRRDFGTDVRVIKN